MLLSAHSLCTLTLKNLNLFVGSALLRREFAGTICVCLWECVCHHTCCLICGKLVYELVCSDADLCTELWTTSLCQFTCTDCRLYLTLWQINGSIRSQAACRYSSQHILCMSILCHKFQQSQVIDETRPLCVSCVFTAMTRLVFTSFKLKCYKSDLLQRFWIIQQDPSTGYIESVLWWRVIIYFYCNAHSRRDSAPALTASQNHLQTLAGIGCQSMGTAPAALRREEHPSHPTQQLLSATSVATTQ